MTDEGKIEALISMLLAFRHEPHLTEIIDRKLAEICPEETARVQAIIDEGFSCRHLN